MRPMVFRKYEVIIIDQLANSLKVVVVNLYNLYNIIWANSLNDGLNKVVDVVASMF